MRPLLSITTLLIASFLLAQDNSSVMQKLARDLIVKLSNENVKELAMTQLEYQGNTNSEIGKHFADEVGFHLVNQGAKFAVIPSDKVELAYLQYEAKKDQNSANSQSSNSNNNQSYNQNNSNSANNNQEKVNWAVVGGAVAALVGLSLLAKDKGPLPKVTHFLSGKIIDLGDELEVTYMITNKKKAIVANSKAKFLKTSEIMGMIGPVAMSSSQPSATSHEIRTSIRPGSTAPNYAAPTPSSAPAVAQWKNNSVVMEMKGCTQSGQNIECELQVTSRESNITFSLYRGYTVLFSAENQNEFYPFEAVVGDKSTTGHSVEKTLIAKYNAKITLRFTQVNQKVRNIAALIISCNDSSSSWYKAEFNNIPVY